MSSTFFGCCAKTFFGAGRDPDVPHHKGPFDAHELAESATINLDLRLGFFRNPIVRKAFEKRQMPFVRRRSVVVVIAFAGFSITVSYTHLTLPTKA